MNGEPSITRAAQGQKEEPAHSDKSVARSFLTKWWPHLVVAFISAFIGVFGEALANYLLENWGAVGSAIVSAGNACLLLLDRWHEWLRIRLESIGVGVEPALVEVGVAVFVMWLPLCILICAGAWRWTSHLVEMAMVRAAQREVSDLVNPKTGAPIAWSDYFGGGVVMIRKGRATLGLNADEERAWRRWARRHKRITRLRGSVTHADVVELFQGHLRDQDRFDKSIVAMLGLGSVIGAISLLGFFSRW